ncbi:copper amine oxidase [Grosmannia clavigera kw1407]|uniref:Amine oxidase n=1 Tax=Grosmannia clavigera (strain kw1407 / UAMH 11150) TaxID=655863 RepID=F0XA83_GROCL|nr:copper amine oxidase [Grosmannia clavigera kw1407]EFX05222.1 copper amine oxidase [Grosmannia clavigera kw1407]
MAVHPLADLTAEEVVQAANLIRAQHPGAQLAFKAITLEEPDKALTLQYLEAEHAGRSVLPPKRIAFAAYYIRKTTDFFTALVHLEAGEVAVTKQTGAGEHGNVDFAEVLEVEKATMACAEVQAEIARLQLPENLEVVPEPWGFGSDGGEDDMTRLFQVYMFLRDKTVPDSNHYARPLAFSAIFDPTAMRLVRIQRIATGADHTIAAETAPYKVKPGSDYVPAAQPQLRTDLKPLQVVQPCGPSFDVSADRIVRWQKWEMRVGFNYREGVVLRDVRYDGRPLFYRISLSEMCVPYGDPRSPYHRKMAFDLGDVGAGMVANNLRLGCDCLGSIAYLDGLVCDRDGQPVVMPNAVCIHEQDNGIGWKHTNYRTNNAFVVRNRELVVQTILTVSNYEYILAFIFNQAGEIEYQVRATGMLSTTAIDEGLNVDFGTVVHPGVLASFHQHILSLRIDPAIGSYTDGNTVVQQEAQQMPMDAFNPYGNGYRAVKTEIAQEGGHDLDWTKSRAFVVKNPHIANPVNGLPISYKLEFPPVPTLMSHPESYNAKRAEFADHHLYLTKYRPDELYSGGKFTNQSRGHNGIKSWIEKNHATIIDEDVVVWVQFGLNHFPRIEDFPVMPVEKVSVVLRPVNFFTKNPALDVPPSSQATNQSVLVSGDKTDCASGCAKLRTTVTKLRSEERQEARSPPQQLLPTGQQKEVADMQRRMLSKEEEEAAGPEVEVRREDQEKINRFSRLHQRELNLEEELKAKNKEKEELDDITMELELIDEDDKVPYKIGDAFFQVRANQAQEMVGIAAAKMEESMGELEDSLGSIREEMTRLKVDLYARFGRSINLET